MAREGHYGGGGKLLSVVPVACAAQDPDGVEDGQAKEVPQGCEASISRVPHLHVTGEEHPRVEGGLLISQGLPVGKGPGPHRLQPWAVDERVGEGLQGRGEAALAKALRGCAGGGRQERRCAVV